MSRRYARRALRCVVLGWGMLLAQAAEAQEPSAETEEPERGAAAAEEPGDEATARAEGAEGEGADEEEETVETADAAADAERPITTEPAARVARPRSPTDRHSVGQHAFTLREREVVLGVWRTEYGVIDHLTVGTHTPYWFAGLPFATTFPSVYARGAYTFDGWFTVGARAGLLFADLGQIAAQTSDEPPVQGSRLFVLPVGLTLTANVDWFTASAELVYTFITGDAAIDVGQSAVGAFLYVETLQLYANLQARVSDEVAFTAQLRYVPWHGPAIVGVGFQPDEDTTITGEVAASVSSLTGSAAVLGGMFLTFGVFNLRFAAGYGRFFLADLGLIAPIDFVQLDLDAYFRFDV